MLSIFSAKGSRLDSTSTSSGMSRTYFPLPYNDRQLSIISRLHHNSGIVVQGPPGTGKSTTITNLICHLLATANKVLVTSHKPNALKVLKGMLPKGITALCVNLLDNDTQSLDELQQSVSNITSKYQSWNQNYVQKEISKLEKKLDKKERERAELYNLLVQIREAETYEHTHCDGSYRGTAQRISETINNETETYGWLEWNFDSDTSSPLKNEEASELLFLLRKFDSDITEELSSDVIPLEKLPSPQDFGAIVSNVDSTKQEWKNLESNCDKEVLEQLMKLDSGRLSKLREVLEIVYLGKRKIEQKGINWIKQALNDSISEVSKKWSELYQSSKPFIGELVARSREAMNHKIMLSEYIPIETVLYHAKRLLEHLDAGKGLGFFVFQAKVVKDARYLIKETSIDGAPCRDSNALQTLIHYLELKVDLQKLYSIWDEVLKETNSPLNIQATNLVDHFNALEEILNLTKEIKEFRNLCHEFNLSIGHSWHMPDEIRHIRNSFTAVDARSKLECVNQILNKVSREIKEYSEFGHPVHNRCLASISNRDVQNYKETYFQIHELGQLKAPDEKK